MTIATFRLTVVGGAPKVKVFTAPSPGWVSITANGSGIYIGNAGLTYDNGFKMGQTTITLKVDGGDELWALATSDTVLCIIGQPD